MATKQNDIRDAMISTIADIANIHKVGTYPDNVAKIGHNFPSVMVGDGDEIWESSSGDREIVAYNIPMYVYHNVKNRRTSAMNTITNEVIKAILADLTQDGNCINTEIESVEKGDYSETEDYYNPGFYPNLTIRRINITITYFDNRSC